MDYKKQQKDLSFGFKSENDIHNILETYFGTLFNSDFLLERRGGLKIEINTADLANSEPSNWFTKTHKKLLQVGFLPTQWGDSFAIAFGGATWYRNNINRLLKQVQVDYVNK